MTEIELLACAAVIAFGLVYSFRKRGRRPIHGLPHLENAMQGTADEEQLRELADALAKSVVDRAKSLGKPPLFVSASGDLYDDFFPPMEPRPGWTAVQFANVTLADCVRRYRDARNNRNVDITDFQAYALCAGAGIAVSSFRRLAGSFPDIRDLAEFLGPDPEPDQWEAYKEYYLEAGMLLGLSRSQIDAKLMKRWERYGGSVAGKQNQL